MILFIWFSLRVILFTIVLLGLFRYGLKEVRVMDAILSVLWAFFFTIMLLLGIHPFVMLSALVVIAVAAAFVFDVLRDETDVYDRVLWEGGE